MLPPQRQLFTDAARRLPGTAGIVLVLDGRWLGHAAVHGFDGLLPGARKKVAGMVAEIRELCLVRLGLDCTELQRIYGFFDLRKRALGLVLTGAKGTLKGKSPRTIGGVQAFSIFEGVLVSQVAGALLVGNERGLGQLIAVGRNKQLSLARAQDYGELRAFVASAPSPRRLLALARFGGLPFKLPVSLGSTLINLDTKAQLRIAVSGSPEALQQARLLVRGLLGALHQKMESRKHRLVATGPLLDALLSILVSAHAGMLHDALALKIAGGQMALNLDLSRFAGTMMLLGVLSAVAIPAFLKYMRRARATEAPHQLRRLQQSARMAYETQRQGTAGGKCPALPMAVDWTPTKTACDYPSQRYPGLAADWKQPTWAWLRFRLEVPHYDQYRVVTHDKTLRLEARGDLNCNGRTSLFRLSGRIARVGARCALHFNPQMQIEDELE